MPAPRSPRLMIAACVVSAMSGLASLPAQAADYAGTWAADLTQCKTGQDSPDAPLILTAKGYDQHEAHCTFASVQKTGSASWRMRARCSVEGDRQAHTFDISVDGRTLTLRDGYGARRLVRCR